MKVAFRAHRQTNHQTWAWTLEKGENRQPHTSREGGYTFRQFHNKHILCGSGAIAVWHIQITVTTCSYGNCKGIGKTRTDSYANHILGLTGEGKGRAHQVVETELSVLGYPIDVFFPFEVMTHGLGVTPLLSKWGSLQKIFEGYRWPSFAVRDESAGQSEYSEGISKGRAAQDVGKVGIKDTLVWDTAALVPPTAPYVEPAKQ
eukprot:1153012-Pelagomonas_calceolata.AAC.3